MVVLVVLQGSQCWTLQVRSAMFVMALGFVRTELKRESEILREIGREKRVREGERECSPKMCGCGSQHQSPSNQQLRLNPYWFPTRFTTNLFKI